MSKYQPYANSDQIVSYICLSTILMYALRSSHPAKIILNFLYLYHYNNFFNAFQDVREVLIALTSLFIVTMLVFLELLIVVYL